MAAGEPSSAADRQRGLPLLAKRLLDVTAAGLVLVVGGPFLLLVALLLAVCQGFPVLFRQRRAGRGERPFTLLKFRTMRTAYGPDGRLLPDAERVTAIGRLVRRLSLDELPQFINVLRGEMSLVGTRPLPVAYPERMTPEQRRRHSVLPGMTTLDAVRGRYANTWERQFELDAWYVDHWSLRLDFAIARQTVWLLLTNRDQRLANQPPREEFRGTLSEAAPGATSDSGNRV